MGEALITRRGGGSGGVAAGFDKDEFYYSGSDKTISSSSDVVLTMDFSSRPITDNFIGHVRYGGGAFFTALDKKASFEYSGSTITAWFTLSDSKVSLHMNATNTETVNLYVACGFY